MKFKYKYIMSILLVALTIACSDDDKLPVDFDELINSGLPFASRTDFESEFKPIEGELFLKEADLEDYNISITFELNSPEDGANVNAIKIVGSFKDNNVEIVGNDTIDVSKSNILLKEISSSQFSTSSNDLPEVTFTITGQELLQAFDYTAVDIKGLDVFTYRVILVTDEGEFTDVSSNFDNQSADHSFDAQVLCPSDFSAQFTYLSTNLSTPEIDEPDGGWPNQSGSGEFREIREGVYEITPGVTFGALELWNRGVTAGPDSVFLRDNCGTFSFIGEDSDDNGYQISPFVIDGNQLTFTWENDEDESGTVTLTRTDGQIWPDLN